MTRFFINKTEGFSVRCVKNRKVEEPPVVKDSIPAPVPDSIIDPRDNHVYRVVQFGNNTWMAENLKATKFNDGTEIPQIIDKIAWNRLESPAFCWYENHDAYSTYGAIYNWYAVNSNRLCPVGWHIPSYEDWTDLITRSGGLMYAGIVLKEPGTAHWEKPNGGYPSYNHFNALPGGLRDESGDFSEIGKTGYWWSILKDEKPSAWYIIMNSASNSISIRNFKNKPIGMSVRCVKD
jgi:uncharacterized protein (TIGR02145 family)